MKKKTAVEWLVKELIKSEYIPTDSSIMNYVIQQAIALEKEQITDAYRHGRTDEQSSIPKWHDRSSSQYYTDTYQSNN